MLGEAALGADMICGGSCRMLVELAADPAPYRAARRLLDEGRRVLLAKRMDRRPEGRGSIRTGCLVGLAVLDEALGAVHGSTAGLDLSLARKALASGRPALSEDGIIVYDSVFPEERLVILGGGHVGLALARIASGLDFSVIVVDDRPEMADPARFPAGVEVLRSGYAEAVEKLRFDAATYAVVLTRGHVYDLESVRALLGREYRYAGMIGSLRKTRLIFEQLRNEGLDPERMDAFYAPIGLDIAAETPEEIAVCILGEMIAVRRNAGSLAAMAEARRARRGR
jgi:xanthine dehydrogenase accessory factor